jgi:predicted ArsR family transcriptional regulator
MGEARIRDELAQGPLTDDDLAERLGIPRAIVRHHLWTMVYRHRTVTCDRAGRFHLGEPPEDWPKMKRTA